jgi:hypothetical protein
MSGALLGPLHGVPTAMKDLFDFKPGWPTTFGGVRALKDFVPDFYCSWAERMEQAGAIIVGKTNSPVMGFRGTCDNPLFGPSRNPFDTSRNTGGSSGGSAGAVAGGLLGGRGDRRRRLRAHPGVVVRRLRLQAVLRPGAVRGAAERVHGAAPVPVRGRDHAHGRGCRAGHRRDLGL